MKKVLFFLTLSLCLSSAFATEQFSPVAATQLF